MPRGGLKNQTSTHFYIQHHSVPAQMNVTITGSNVFHYKLLFFFFKVTNKARKQDS